MHTRPFKNAGLYEAPRVKRLVVINTFSSFLPFQENSRERSSALMAWQSPCLAAPSGQPPRARRVAQKARGVDGESACRATLMPGPIRRKCNLRFCVAC